MIVAMVVVVVVPYKIGDQDYYMYIRTYAYAASLP